MRPGVNIQIGNGGLGILPASETGVSVLLIAAPAAPLVGYSVPILLKTKADAAAAFAGAANSDILLAIREGFYGEAPEGTRLYVYAMAQTTTLAQLALVANSEPALNAALSADGLPGAARLVAYCKQPAPGYVVQPVQGFDGDVHDAVTAAQTLANTWLANKKPFRFFVQGFGYTGVAGDAKDYSATTNRNGHIVVGTVKSNDAAGGVFATLLALGRAARVPPQQNIGRVRTGALNIDPAYAVRIGAAAPESVAASALDTQYEKRYIFPDKHATAAGYKWIDDNSLTAPTDDYNNLRNGRVMDNAVRVAFRTYYQELLEDVEVEAGGRMARVVEKALEASIESAISQAMPGELSTKNDGSADVECQVNPDIASFAALYSRNGITTPNFNIHSGGNVYIFIKLRPKGCLKQLNVYLGFTA